MHYVEDRVYCSDSCARTDPEYRGWNGCHENPDAAEYCTSCGVLSNVNPECGCTSFVVNRFLTDETEYCDHGNAIQVPVTA